MGRLGIAIALLGGVASTGQASADVPQSTPSFKISPATDRCVASRSFKRGKHDLQVAIEARPSSATYQLRIYVPGNLRRWDDGKYSLGNVKLESDYVMARSSNPPGTTIYLMSPSRAELAASGPSPTLQMREILDPSEIVISGLGEAVALVDACAADLLERWGYSKEFQRQLETPPKAQKTWAHYVSTQDFPLSAIWALKGGETHVMVDVDAGGKASNCRIVRKSGNDDIDRKTCTVVTERARYEPARNAKGEAIGAPHYMTFRWEIPSP